MPTFCEVHGEIDTATEGAEPNVVEPSNRRHIAGDRPNGQIFKTSPDRFIDCPGQQGSANRLTTQPLGHDDGFDLAAGPVVEQAHHARHCFIDLGNPGADPFRCGQVVIESSSRIVPTNGRVFVQAPMVLRQLCPKVTASWIVGLPIGPNGQIRGR